MKGPRRLARRPRRDGGRVSPPRWAANLIGALGPEGRPDLEPKGRSELTCCAKAGVTPSPDPGVECKSADWTSADHQRRARRQAPDRLPRLPRARPPRPRSRWSGHESVPLRVVAALPNRLARRGPRRPGQEIRAFAPSLRNMLDRDPPVSAFADSIDILCCNRGEWEALADREQVAWQRLDPRRHRRARSRGNAPLHDPRGRSRPPGPNPRLPPVPAPLATPTGPAKPSPPPCWRPCCDHGWAPGPSPHPDLARLAAERASVAAALVLDRVDFGFPRAVQIDEAIRAGRVD